MDISFKSKNKKFNYRVCGIIINDGKVLAMHDSRYPYYYLPGGRVKMGETAEHAVVREIKEEIGITMNISRPLWLNQAFFNEDATKLDFHEICIYFLMDELSLKSLPKGDSFTIIEGNHTQTFEWLEFSRLKDEYFYPTFLKESIYDLPNNLTIRTEYQ